jgi:hypothetical protein
MKPDWFALYLREDGMEHVLKLRDAQKQADQPNYWGSLTFGCR